MNSRHNKYVSVTDWFAPPPSSKGVSASGQATGIAASGASFVGGSWGLGSSNNGPAIQIIKTNDTTPASNSNVYSALRVHNSYISKDKDERTSCKLSSDVGFEVGEFVSGVSGAICYIDPDTLQTSAEVDRLKVRIKAYFETLEIVNVNSVGGKQIISPAGAITCAMVETKGPVFETIHVTDNEGNPLYDENGNPVTETIIVSEDNGIPEDTYRCYFLAEQDGDKVENRFHEGDQAYCQTFNAFTGELSNASNTYYWRLVTGVTVNPIEKDGKQWHYIDLSISDCDTNSDAPKEGDIICHRGSRTDNDRRNLLEFSAVDLFSPSITLYLGVGISDPANNQYPYSLTGKDVISYGVNKMTNRAFMNVYGDMYVGDRDGKSFLRFDEVSGLTIKGNLSAGTTLEGSDLTLEQRINAAADAYKEDVDLFKNEILKGFGEIQDQIDGAIETYFLDPVPTLDNEPAVNWTTDVLKLEHVGDLYYDAEGNSYRFQYESITNSDGSVTNKYYWNEIADTDVSKALAAAKKAQDTADSKRKIFILQPKTNDSYEVGDMWANASYLDPNTERLIYDGDLLRAVTSKEEGYAFSINHWTLASKYTDDTAAIAALELADAALTAANKALADATAAANRLNAWAEDGVISPTEKQGIKEEYARVIADKDHINDEYDRYFLGTPTDYNNAYLPYITSLINIFTSELETVPIPNNFETQQTTYYTARTNALNIISSAARKVADDALDAADNAKEEAEKALTSAEEAKEVVYDMNLAVTGSAEYVREAFADGIINKGERASIENYIHQIETVLAQVEESYKEVESNQLLKGSNELENLKTSYSRFSAATTELKLSISEISKLESVANINKATFENKYNNFNAAYSTYTQWLNACSKYIEYALNSRVDATIEALGGYSYLKNALNNEKTTVTGGLVLTTMLALGYTDKNQEYHINAGINGAASKNDDIVLWAGGSNIDRFVEPNNTQAADFLVRGDGTGYAAGGNFWWDSNGIIHADPMSFVISEQSVGMLLASFQVYYDANPVTGKTEPYAIDPKVPFTTLQVASDLVLSDSAVLHFGNAELGYDATNNAVYLRSLSGNPINFYTTGGIAMYGQGNTSVNTIMDAIANCIDPDTLEIKDGILTVIGGSGGSGGGISKVNVIGNGNAITTASISGNTLTLTKNSSFVMSTGTGASGTWNINISGESKKVGASTAPTDATYSLYVEKYKSGITCLQTGLSAIGDIPANSSVLNVIFNASKAFRLISEKSGDLYYQTSNDDSSGWKQIRKIYDDTNLTKSTIGLDKVENVSLSSWSGTTNINTVGTITNGTWNGSKISNSYLSNSAITVNGSSVSLGGSFNTASITAGTAGTNTATSGATLAIPYLTMNAFGIVTSYGTHTHTINALPNSSLANSSITIAGTSVSLGGSITAATIENALIGNKNNFIHSGNIGQQSVKSATSATTATTASTCTGNAASASKVNSTLTFTGYQSKTFNGSEAVSVAIPNNTNQLTNGAGYITGINKTMVTTALGYTPYDSTNPNKYITSSASISGNAGSATKLANKRKIWGVEFNGESDVSGAITGATSGTFSAAVSIGKTLSVAGASTFTGNTTNKAIAYFANGTTYYVNASGAAKFASLTSAGAIGGTTGSFSSTLAVTGASTFTGKTTHNGGIGATSGAFSSTLSVTSTSTFTGKTTHNGGIGSTSGSFSSTLSVTSTSTLVGGATIGKSTADNGTYKLYVNGSSYTSGNFLSGGGITMYSMRKLKDIIDEKGLTLDELSIIKPTRFTWKDKRDNKIHIGGIADDVMKVLPEVVYKTDDDVLTMDYGNAAFAVASSLIKPVVDHEKRIAILEEENKELRNEIERLKSA